MLTSSGQCTSLHELFESPEDVRLNPGSDDAFPNLTNELSAWPGLAEITEQKSRHLLLLLIDTAANLSVNYSMGFVIFKLRFKERGICRPQM